MGLAFRLLTTFGPLSGAKFWVAVIMAAAQFVQVYSGYDLGLDQETVTAVLGGITAFLVWLVPNKPKSHDFPDPPKGLY